MNASIYRISLELQDTQANVNLDVKRGDTKRILHISLTDGGKPYQISDECTAVFTALKPDGKKVFNDCQISGNEILYTLTPQTVVAEGVCQCEIKLYGADSGLLTSARFELAVNETVYNEGDVIESTDEFNELARLIGEASAVPSSVLLKEDDKLDALVENGRYYLAGGTDNLLIRQMLRDAGVPVPEEMDAEGVLARAMFVDVTRVERVSTDSDDPVGQPCQQLTVYFDLEKGDGTWVYEFHRVHDFTGSHPDGSAWGNWITATKNHLEVEPEVFIAEYGVTTADEVFRAFLDGKVCFAKHDDDVLPMLNCNENIKAMLFCGLCSGVYKEFRLLPAGWTEKTEFRHKVTAVTDGATDNQIPTAKAVWDLGLKKLDANKLPEAVEAALAQAKASGAFDGPQGEQGPKGEQGEPGPAEVFIAKYGETTNQEIWEAAQAGKACFVANGGAVLPLTLCDGTRYMEFTKFSNGENVVITVQKDVWEVRSHEYLREDEIRQVFTAEYGVTTADEVCQAFLEGKGCFAKRNAVALPLTFCDTGRKVAHFCGMDDGFYMEYRLSAGGWQEIRKDYRKAEEIAEDTSDDLIPTVGAVRSYVAENATEGGVSELMVVNITGGGPGGNFSADKTFSEILDAVLAGRGVLAIWGGRMFTATGRDPGRIYLKEFIINGYGRAGEFVCSSADVWTYTAVDLPSGADIQPLTFTGAVEATYDGSKPVEVAIPQGGGGGEWELIGEIVFSDATIGTALWEWTPDKPYAHIYVTADNCLSNQRMGFSLIVNGQAMSKNISYKTDSAKSLFAQVFADMYGENWLCGYFATEYVAAIGSTLTYYNIPARAIGRAAKVAISQSAVQDYQAYSGTIKIWGCV